MNTEKQRIEDIVTSWMASCSWATGFRVYVTRTKQDEYRVTITVRQYRRNPKVMSVYVTPECVTTPEDLQSFFGVEGLSEFADELMYAY